MSADMEEDTNLQATVEEVTVDVNKEEEEGEKEDAGDEGEKQDGDKEDSGGEASTAEGTENKTPTKGHLPDNTIIEDNEPTGPIVTIFTAYYCPFCIKAKELLKQHNVKYVEIKADNNPTVPLTLQRITDRHTVPQIFFHNDHIGGFSDLSALAKEKGIQAKLKRVNCTTELRQELLPPPVQDAPSFVIRPRKVKLTDTFKVTEGEIVRKLIHPAYGIVLKDSLFAVFTGKKRFFTAKELVSWIETTFSLSSRDEATVAAERLLDAGILVLVDSRGKFEDSNSCEIKLYGHSHACGMLNAWVKWKGEPTRQACQLATILRTIYLDLLAAHTTTKGVDYVTLSTSEAFWDFTLATAELQAVNVKSLSREESLAFYLNVYNLMILHAFAVFGAPSTTLQRNKLFTTTAYVLGGHIFTLNDIENGILRSNSKAPYTLSATFKSSDPRLKLALPKCEPRIHFALNCGAQSCPVVRMYDHKDIDPALDFAAYAFMESGVKLDPDNGVVELSKIFSWFSSDFGRNSEEVLQFINQFLSATRKTQLLEMQQKGKLKVKYTPYNWATNAIQQDGKL